MQTNTLRGMQTMEQSLADLTLKRVITAEAAFSRTTHPEQLRGLLERGGYSPFASSTRPCQPTAPSPHRDEGVTVIDFKKEIKLSDLVRRTAAASRAERAAPQSRPKRDELGGCEEVRSRASSSASRSARRSSRPRGSSTTARRTCASWRGSRSRRASSSAARCATCRRSRRRWTSSSRRTRCRVAASGSGSRRTTSASAASRSPASTTSASSRTRCSSAPTTPSRSRSTRRSSTTASSSEDVDESGTVNRKILLVAAYREPIERYVEAFREAGIQLVGIDLEAFALLRAAGPRRADGTTAEAAVVVVNAGHERTTLAVSDGTRVRVHARPRVGRHEARLRRSPASFTSRSPRRSSSLLDALASSRRPPRASRPTAAANAAARGRDRRELQVLARELVASLEYYQGQPGSLRSPRSCSPAARAASPASPPSSSG